MDKKRLEELNELCIKKIEKKYVYNERESERVHGKRRWLLF